MLCSATLKLCKSGDWLAYFMELLHRVSGLVVLGLFEA